MDNSKMTFRSMRKPPGQQPSSDDQPICPSSQGYTQRANTDDDFWAQPEENKTYQPGQASKQDRSQSGPMGQEGVKGRQAKAQPYKGAELLTELNRRIEVSKRKRAGSTSDVQDESAAKEQKLTKAGTDAGGQDHAIFEEDRKRPVEGRLKTTIAGEEEENPFPVKQPKLTAYQHIGFGPLTMNPRVPKKEATDPSVTYFNVRRNQQASPTQPRALTVHEVAAIEEARTHEGLRVCAVTDQHYVILQEVQGKAAPQRKYLYALSTS